MTHLFPRDARSLIEPRRSPFSRRVTYRKPSLLATRTLLLAVCRSDLRSPPDLRNQASKYGGLRAFRLESQELLIIRRLEKRASGTAKRVEKELCIDDE